MFTSALIERIGIVIATAALVGGGKFLIDWNTTDDEVLPDVASLIASDLEQKKQTEILTRVLRTQSVNQAQQTLRVTSKEIRLLEEKPEGKWTPADKQAYKQAQKQYDSAMGQLSQGELQ